MMNTANLHCSADLHRNKILSGFEWVSSRPVPRLASKVVGLVSEVMDLHIRFRPAEPV